MTVAKTDLTAEDIRRLLGYEPETGIFVWLVDPPVGPRCKGKIAGHRVNTGYTSIQIKGSKYVAHRLAWIWMTGEWPSLEVDHENNIRSDNRWSNLRLATGSQNVANGKVRSNNRLGLKGVTICRNKYKKYRASVRKEGKEVYWETFDCPAAAHLGYFLAAVRHFGEFARAR